MLATGRKDLEDFLVQTGDTIAEHFPDDEHSPFVQERFHEDWSHDRKWGWQQDSAVVGHNLKIAWNLMRIHHLRPNDEYVALANKIADTMPAVGSDQQRGGWYDVVERRLEPGQKWHRFVWHDRKAWWQQEQAILAYHILAGSLGHAEHARLARESAAFYNAHFLDHDEGGMYFNVLANGIPYLVGNERLKGSHSMSGYHSMELCYLAAVYTQPAGQRRGPRAATSSPRRSASPTGSSGSRPTCCRRAASASHAVWIDDAPYEDFDAECPHREAAGRRGVPGQGADRVGHRQVRLPVQPGRRQRSGDHAGQARPRRGHQAAPRPRPGHRGPAAAHHPHGQGAGDHLPPGHERDRCSSAPKWTIGEDVYVVGANEQRRRCFVEAGDADASGGDFCRVDDESEIPA